jgi:hypothetical protein
MVRSATSAALIGDSQRPYGATRLGIECDQKELTSCSSRSATAFASCQGSRRPAAPGCASRPALSRPPTRTPATHPPTCMPRRRPPSATRPNPARPGPRSASECSRRNGNWQQAMPSLRRGPARLPRSFPVADSKSRPLRAAARHRSQTSTEDPPHAVFGRLQPRRVSGFGSRSCSPRCTPGSAPGAREE